MKNHKKALCLISGGMDSLVSACIAKKEHEEIIALHITYFQRTYKREMQAFHEICDNLKIEKKYVVELSFFREIGASALTDEKIPVPQNRDINDEIPVSYVPFRNATFLSVATSFAEALGANFIYIGANQVDSSGYPDCRDEFFKVFNQLIEKGTKPESNIKVITPLINMTKAQIIKRGLELDAPFHLSWSCYKNSQKACGLCDSCILRLRGFSEAGIKDPIEYEYPVE